MEDDEAFHAEERERTRHAKRTGCGPILAHLYDEVMHGPSQKSDGGTIG